MQKKIKIFCVSLLAIFLIFRLVTFVILTNLVKNRKPALLEAFSNKLGREIVVGEVKVNFLSEICLSDLEIRSPGEKAPIEYFRVARLVIHLNFLNLLKGSKDYADVFRKISFQGGNIKLRVFRKPVSDVKGKVMVTNHDFYLDHLKFPLGETELILKGWVRDFVDKPVVDLDIETHNFKAGDLLILWPKLEPLKLAGRGKLSGRLTGQPGNFKVLGEIMLNNMVLGKLQLPQIKSNFYFGNGFINFSPFQAEILKGEVSGKIKITEIFSQPNLAGELNLKALRLPWGECFGELKFTGDLLAPKVLGRLDFRDAGEKFNLEKIACQLRFLPQGIYGEAGEVFLPKMGKMLWKAELQKDLGYALHFFLPPLRSKNLSSYQKQWLDLPGVLRLDGKVTGVIGSPEVDYEGKLAWDNFGKGETFNGSVLSSGKFECRFKGRKKGDNLRLQTMLGTKDSPHRAKVNLSGQLTAAGLEGEILAEPIVIQERVYTPLTGIIKIESKKIIIENLKWLDSYFIEGEINFSPLAVNLSLFLREADIVPILSFSSAFSEEDNFGTASGEIECKGKWPEITVKAMVELKDSKIGKKNIEYAKFQVEGTNPYFTLKESPVIFDDTTLICRGPIDLSKGGKEVFQDIEYALDESQMVWKGWKINQEEGEKELSLTKDVAGGFSVSLRAPTLGEPEEDLAQDPGPEVELEYNIKGREKFKLRMDEDDDFLGIEHEVKF